MCLGQENNDSERWHVPLAVMNDESYTLTIVASSSSLRSGVSLNSNSDDVAICGHTQCKAKCRRDETSTKDGKCPRHRDVGGHLTSWTRENMYIWRDRCTHNDITTP